MAKYEVKFLNNASYSGSICVYATCPDQQEVQDDLRSLAWFVKAVNPGVNANFSWSLDYAFAWAETGFLKTGVLFEVSGLKAADPSDKTNRKNRVFFDKNDHGYYFDPDPNQAALPKSGSLMIECGSHVANEQASIGIGIKGAAALAVPARPNLKFTFLPHLKYWIAFGNFEPGVVIDVNSMTSVCPVSFPTNVFERTIILQANNLWAAGDPYPLE